MQKALGAALVAIALAGLRCNRSNQYAAPPANTYSVQDFDLASGASGEKLRGAAVLPEFFVASNARPYLGRFFLPGDYASTAQPVVVISHDLWVRRFNSQPFTIGTNGRLSGRNVTVVGVGPSGVEFPNGATLLVPASLK
jgi:putative ABC transport system permease protein